MSEEIVTVPLSTADFILGRMIATAMLNEKLNAEIKQLKEAIHQANHHAQERIEWMQKTLIQSERRQILLEKELAKEKKNKNKILPSKDKSK